MSGEMAIFHTCLIFWQYSFSPLTFFAPCFPNIFYSAATMTCNDLCIHFKILKFNIFYKFINHYFYLKNIFWFVFNSFTECTFSIYKCWYILANREKFNITCIKCKCKHGLSSFRILHEKHLLVEVIQDNSFYL